VSARGASRRRSGRPRERAGATPVDVASAVVRPVDGQGAGETLLLAVLMACLALRALASLSASSWLWGLNTLRDWPAPWPVVLPALAALAFVPAVARAAAPPLERIGGALAVAGAPVRVLLAAAVAVALFLLRDPVRFVGDAGSRLMILSGGGNAGVLMPQLSPLDRLVSVGGARWLVQAGIAPLVAVQTIGALLGAALTLAVLAFLRAAGARGAAWLAAAVVVLASGSLVHFAGYGKYGLLLVGLALAATGVVRLARGRRGSGTLAAGLILALLSHRSAYVVLPAGLWAFGAAWRRASGGERMRVALAGAATAAVALALLPWTVGVLIRVDLARNVVGTSTLGRIEPVRQLANLANALFLLSPLWPAGLVAVWLGVRRGSGKVAPGGTTGAAVGAAAPGPADTRPGFPLGGVAALAVACWLLGSLATRGKQGPLRDWYNQAGPALLVTLVTAYALIACWRRGASSRTVMPVCTTALMAGLALWGIHADPGIGGRRVATLLADPAAWSREEWSRAHEFVAARAFDAGRYDEAARAYEIVVAGAPSSRMVDNLAITLGMAGRREESARVLARAMLLPQSSATMWIALGSLALTLGDTARAAACADSAQARQRLEVGARLPGPGHSAGQARPRPVGWAP
jgi:hypothetical protein